MCKVHLRIDSPRDWRGEDSESNSVGGGCARYIEVLEMPFLFSTGLS